MADEQFNLGEALGGYEQAKADRDFYLSMVQGGTTAASPIAAYLAGVAGVKMGQMRSEAQQLQDAKDATENAIKRGETLRNNLFQLAKSARGGEIAPASAATLAGAIVKEMGYTPREFDTDNLILTYSKDGEDYELDLSESPISKQQREAGKLALAEARERRLAQQAETKRQMDQVRLDNLLKGKGTSKKEKDFIEANRELFDKVFNLNKKVMTGYEYRMRSKQPLEERLKQQFYDDKKRLQSWLTGIKTLDEDAQEVYSEYTSAVESLLQELNNPRGEVSLAPGEKRNQGFKAF